MHRASTDKTERPRNYIRDYLELFQSESDLPLMPLQQPSAGTHPIQAPVQVGSARRNWPALLRQAVDITTARPPAALTLLIALGAFVLGLVVGASVTWVVGPSVHAAPKSRTLMPARQNREQPNAAAPSGALSTDVVGFSGVSTPATRLGELSQEREPMIAGRRPADVDRGMPLLGTLIVESNPAGADVLLNGTLYGPTPIILGEQPVGSRAVRVEMSGYEPWTSAVQIVTGQETRIRADLSELQPARRP